MLRAYFNGHQATVLLDSGAATEFIDTSFAGRCGLPLTSSDRAVKLADGSIVPATGTVVTDWSLEAARPGGAAIPFNSAFVATKLEGYDAIIGMTWLARYNPIIGWSSRSIVIKVPGASDLVIRPLANNGRPQPTTLATISLKSVQKLYRAGEIDQVFAIFVKPADNSKVASRDRECPEAEALLREFADVFPDDLPPGLPPVRGVQHTIELKPNSRPPACRPLRHQSSKDLAVFEEYM